jgi:hypothetical protein
MMSFREYLGLREGLWLADKNAVPGMTNVNPLLTRKTRSKGATRKPSRAANPFTPVWQSRVRSNLS